MLTTTADRGPNQMNARGYHPSGQIISDELHSKSLLFVHGWWGGPWVWDRFIEYFSGLGFQCSALNLNEASASKSDENAGKVSFRDHLDPVLEKTRELGDPIVIGHSAGGLLIQKLLEQVKLPAAVLVASAAPREIFALRSWPSFQSVVRHGPAILLQRPFLPGKVEMCELNLNRLSPEEQTFVYDKMVPTSGKQAMEIALTGIPVDARRVKTPIMVVNGTDDKLTPVSVANSIANKYGATYRTYSGNGHYVMREHGWEQVANDINQWLCETVPHTRGAERGEKENARSHRITEGDVRS